MLSKYPGFSSSLLVASFSATLAGGCGTAENGAPAQEPVGDAIQQAAGSVNAAAGTSVTRWRVRVAPGESLAETIRKWTAGDLGTTGSLWITLAPGAHAAANISRINPPNRVQITAEQGATIASLSIRDSSNIDFSAVQFLERVVLTAANSIGFYSCTFQTANTQGPALEFNGQSSGGANHNIDVVNSSLKGGHKTVFLLGKFAPSETWNHDIRFEGNTFTCGTQNCMQISAGRDIEVTGNVFNATNSGILAAGAQRTVISRNRFRGPGSGGTALSIATPGSQWDNFPGVEELKTFGNVVSNNIVEGWGLGIMLSAVLDTDIVFNTFAQTPVSLFMLNHRPTSQTGEPVMGPTGERVMGPTDGTRMWNNILSDVHVGTDERRPSYESHNLYTVATAAAGRSPFVGDPLFGPDYTLGAGSPAINRGVAAPNTPVVDFDGLPRRNQPDLGAREVPSTL